MSRACGPHSPKQARAEVTSRIAARAGIAADPARQVLPDPAEVVVAEGRAGDDEEALRGQAGDGEVALDAAAPVEHLGVDDRADRAVDVVRAEALEERERARRPRPRSWRSSTRRRGRRPAASRGPRRRSPATSARRPSRAAGAPRASARVDTPAPSSFGVNQFGRSHIDFSPKTAPSAATSSYAGESRSGRPASRSSFG